ncbi:MAG: dTDP-4-dehydrorhamnose 3,5-epimerase [Saprospiraceae bacterium]|jgi:dTDP-4-dehydrorhamnose 3,5-epimerase|nr:dTDP-4-dehydrorhamnose 3,5-epimerase [Saprospiraceae bacterium]MBK6480677.1 dTDP-4-dehydrorhamnose 3,5-epimerase [Saprospiraceae bacterium]MBK6816962.1 dTDP-4-dehydrorhamnose 3,5-epimerase [Saprospiraceae bacterium]MBK7371491.1 dTDP-4-dehydrorhamnose 3,5-epimerase [Saprospiraceae bacterium]MBK7436013.1 dTDP-4-dehydrorhamnose 3,5-epimerase [Saprospiraceae bacterium]
MIFEAEYFEVQGPVLIKPKVFADERGYFFESFAQKDLAKIGIDQPFLQDNQAYSHKGTLRGLHFQKNPYAQSKLVRVTSGKVLDVAVDLRKNSPTYGAHVMVMLDAVDHHLFYIPQGFAHGYLVVSDTCTFQYKCDQYYTPASEGGIRFDDPNLKIVWPDLSLDYKVSDRDQHLPLLDPDIHAF